MKLINDSFDCSKEVGMSMFICVNSMIENIQKRISLMG